MKWQWKAFIGICSLALLAISLNIALSSWIKSQLPKIINSGKDSAYKINYKNLNFSLWRGSILAKEIIIARKTKPIDTINQSGVSIKIQSLEVNNFSIWAMFVNNKIKAESITLERPRVIFYKGNEIQKSVKPFDKIISVSDIYVHGGDLKIINIKNNKPIFSGHNISLQLSGILTNEKILKNKIPFEFKNYTIICDSLNYHSDPFYHIRTKKIKISNADLNIDHLEVFPTQDKFLEKIPEEKDRYALFCQSVTGSKMDWGFKGQDLFVHCNVVSLNRAAANIYRSKDPADTPDKKHLPNKLLRDLKFDFKVDTLKVRNSIVQYKEDKPSRYDNLKTINNENDRAIQVKVHNVNLKLEGVLVTNKILKNNIPFECKNYTLICDSLNYDPNPFYNIRTQKIKISKTNLNIDHFAMIPRYSQGEFVSKIPKEKELYKLFWQSVKANTLEIRHFDIWDMLLSNKFKAQSITMEQPKIIIYKKNAPENTGKSVAALFDQTISVSDIFVHHGELKVMDVKNDETILRVHNIDLHLDQIANIVESPQNKIPFEFKNYTLMCDSLNYYPNQFYRVRTNKIKISKTDLNIDHFQMIPKYSRRAFVARIPNQKDLFTLSCQSITSNKIDWGFKGEDLFVHCNAIDLNKAAANIYRSKQPPENLDKKHLYNKLLRELKFDLKIDTLKLRNSIIEYEEEKPFHQGLGKLSFSHFNLLATSICSGFKKEKLPDLKIKVNCLFMGTSPLVVNWKLNVMDRSDGFQIIGTLTNFEAQSIEPFTKPYFNVRTKGIIDEVHFNFTGNDKGASGTFGIKYDNLKFTVYNKDDRKKINEVLTFVAKVFVQPDTNDKIKETDIEVERIPEKSFYNLLWRCILEGLKKTLI